MAAERLVSDPNPLPDCGDRNSPLVPSAQEKGVAWRGREQRLPLHVASGSKTRMWGKRLISVAYPMTNNH
jgi:hypothetical protein